jgi:hypothetical protein
VLDPEEAADAVARRRVSVVALAEVRPRLLLQLGELEHEQLVLGADVAVDRRGAHAGAARDLAQRRVVEAALAEERACGLADARPALAAAQQAPIVRAERHGPRGDTGLHR